MKIYVLQTKRGTETAKTAGTDIFEWMENHEIKVFDYNSFFKDDLDKTLLKKEDILVFYNTIPRETDYDERIKSLKCKKILRTLDGYNTDGIPMRKCINNLSRLNLNKIAYCHKNRNIDSFLKSTGYKYFYMPHCIDFSNKRTIFKKEFDLSISGHLGFESYPTRTRVFNYFNKIENTGLNLCYLPHPGYEIVKASHNITGEAYIDFLSNSWINTTCRGGWRNGMTVKYIEIGKSLSLPIADKPDSLDDRLKELIIEVNSSMDNSQMISNIMYHIENKAILKEKILEYQNICEEVYDQSVVIKDFIRNCKEL